MDFLYRRYEPARDPWEQAKQHKRADECGRQQPCGALDLADLRPSIDENDSRRKHADLAHPVKCARLDPRKTHQEVHDEEGKERYQADGEKIESAVPRYSIVNGFQALAKFRLHPIAQQEAGGEESKRRADGRRERHEDRSGHHPEKRPRHQGHDRRTRKRQCRYDDVDQEKSADIEQRICILSGDYVGLALLEIFKAEDVSKVEPEISRYRRSKQDEQGDALIHGLSDRIRTAGRSEWHVVVKIVGEITAAKAR